MKTKILLLSISALLFLPLTAFAQFSDIEKDSLTYFHDHEIFIGYPDGTFKPEQLLNRAELLKIVMVAHGEELNEPTEECFPDVPTTEWFNSYVCTAKEKGYIEGYPDNTFKPEEYVNKVEALKMIAEVVDWKMLETLTNTYDDTPSSAWYSPYISNGLHYNYIEQNETNQFDPGNSITREDTAEILFRTIVDQRVSLYIGQIREDLSQAANAFFQMESYSKNLSKVDLDEIMEFDGKEYGYKIASQSDIEDYEMAGATATHSFLFLYRYNENSDTPELREFYHLGSYESRYSSKTFSLNNIDENNISIKVTTLDNYEETSDSFINYSLNLIFK